MPNLTLGPRDRVTVANVAGRYAAAVVLSPASRPTGQTDDVDERLIHAARFATYAGALRLVARIARAGRIDVAQWLWTPREHGRFVAAPVAVPYNVDR